MLEEHRPYHKLFDDYKRTLWIFLCKVVLLVLALNLLRTESIISLCV